MMARALVSIGEDGITRCGWSANDAEYRRYHDEEWGTALHGDQRLFEKIALEGFQAGLSWITILKRRPAFRVAFDDFKVESVAAFDADRIERLVADASIIRNRQKIEATVSNARIVAKLTADAPGALDDLVWSFAPASHSRPATVDELLSTTPGSIALSSALRSLGLRFVGPTTMHALMQSAGLINDHAIGCTRGDALESTAAG
jgi:DNA-3-methyladenine glycosylase I